MLRSRLWYAAVLLGAAAFYFCFDDYLSAYVLLAVLLAPLLSLAVSVPAVLSTEISLRVELHAARKNQELPLRVEARSRLPLPCGRAWAVLTARNTLTGQVQREKLFFTPGREPVTVRHSLSSPCCGRVTVSLSRVRACDYMGLFALPVPGGDREDGATFYPAVYRPSLTVGQVPVPDAEADRYSQTRPGDDPSELFAFREYREGDRLSRIHWKLSQKADTLLVKELGLPISDQIFFLLDVNGGGEEADALLDVFATLSGFLSGEEIPHRIGFFAGEQGRLELLDIRGPEDARPALDAILAAGSSPAPEGGRPLRPEALPLGVGHALYLCCRPERGCIDALTARLPAARLSVLTAGEAADTEDLPAVPVLIRPGQVTECLNGFTL